MYNSMPSHDYEIPLGRQGIPHDYSVKTSTRTGSSGARRPDLFLSAAPGLLVKKIKEINRA